MHFLFLDPVADQAENEIDHGIHRAGLLGRLLGGRSGGCCGWRIRRHCCVPLVIVAPGSWKVFPTCTMAGLAPLIWIWGGIALLELDIADWDAEEIAELTDSGILGVGFWKVRTRILDAGRVTDFGRRGGRVWLIARWKRGWSWSRRVRSRSRLRCLTAPQIL